MSSKLKIAVTVRYTTAWSFEPGDDRIHRYSLRTAVTFCSSSASSAWTPGRNDLIFVLLWDNTGLLPPRSLFLWQTKNLLRACSSLSSLMLFYYYYFLTSWISLLAEQLDEGTCFTRLQRVRKCVVIWICLILFIVRAERMLNIF